MMNIITDELKKIQGPDSADKGHSVRKGGVKGKFDKMLAQDSEKLARPDAEGTPAAKVEISEKRRDIEMAKEAADKVPDIRWDRVEELKQRISDGTYNVSAADIAEKMLGDGDARKLLLG